jgi:hypothetical protein
VHALKALGKRLYAGWMRFAYLLGTVNRYVLMTVFYWVIIDLVNLVLRLLRIDLLDRRFRARSSYWHEKLQQPATYKHQF